MIAKLKKREREILAAAMHVYEKLAKGVEKNLETLALPTVAVQTALGNIEVIRNRMGETREEIEFTDDLRICAKDCLMLYQTRLGKVEGAQEELVSPTTEIQKTKAEAAALIRSLDDQLQFPGQDA